MLSSCANYTPELDKSFKFQPQSNNGVMLATMSCNFPENSNIDNDYGARVALSSQNNANTTTQDWQQGFSLNCRDITDEVQPYYFSRALSAGTYELKDWDASAPADAGNYTEYIYPKAKTPVVFTIVPHKATYIGHIILAANQESFRVIKLGKVGIHEFRKRLPLIPARDFQIRYGKVERLAK